MFVQPEKRGALFRAVATQAIKDGGALADNVGKDVDFGVVPVDPFSVMPNLVGLLYRHGVPPWLNRNHQLASRE